MSLTGVCVEWFRDFGIILGQYTGESGSDELIEYARTLPGEWGTFRVGSSGRVTVSRVVMDLGAALEGTYPSFLSGAGAGMVSELEGMGSSFSSWTGVSRVIA